MDSKDIELQPIKTNGNDGAANLSNNDRVAAGNGDGAAYMVPDDAPTERDGLLSAQVAACNGERVPSPHAAEAQKYTPPKRSWRRIKKELREVVFWKVRLWMIIVIILFLIFAAIMITLAVCSVMIDDSDENYDRTLNRVPQYYYGSFQMPNLNFTDELLTRSSNESQTLTADLQEKLADLYGSSPALGRYFARAEIYAFRNGSVIADYQLTFLIPDEKLDQLRNVTLSTEFVYNVFRQFLYDQEAEESELMYIDPLSLNMSLRQ